MLLIKSDDKMFTASCKTVLEHQAFEIVDAETPLRNILSNTGSDLLILDLASVQTDDIPTINGPVIALAALPRYDEAMIMLHKGIRGYGNKYMLSDNLHLAIETVTSGQVWLPPEILTKMISLLPHAEAVNTEAPCHFEGLTAKECEVAKMVAKGLTNKEIATEMNITIRTVKSHLTSIFNKTGYRDRLELAINMK